VSHESRSFGDDVWGERGRALRQIALHVCSLGFVVCGQVSMCSAHCHGTAGAGENDSEVVLGVWCLAPLPTLRAPPVRGVLRRCPEENVGRARCLTLRDSGRLSVWADPLSKHWPESRSRVCVCMSPGARAMRLLGAWGARLLRGARLGSRWWWWMERCSAKGRRREWGGFVCVAHARRSRAAFLHQ